MQQLTQHASYATSAVKLPERFAFWREAVCDAYVRLGCETDTTEFFHGAIEVRRYQTIDISTVGGSRHKVVRRRRDIASSTENDFLLSLQRKNVSRVEQYGNTAVLNPGDFALYSSTDPYTLSLSEGFEEMVLQFPKEKLLSRLPDAEMLTGLQIDGSTGFGQFVSNNIMSMAEMIAHQSHDSRLLLQETVLDLIAAAFAAQRQSRYELSNPEQHILLRAKTFVRSRLADPDLDREMVSRDVGVSVRRLSEIFSASGESLANYIRNLRLDNAAADLRDARFSRQTISEIAIRYGFENFQHFSTLFRRRFDCTPSEYRSADRLRNH